MAMLADSRPRPRLSLGRDLAIDLGTANTRIYSRVPAAKCSMHRPW